MTDKIDLDDLGPLPPLPRKKGRRKRTVTPEERARLTSPEHREHLKRIGPKKGDPKTPGSGNKATPQETKDWLATRSKDVAQLLYDMAFDDTIPARERMKAAMWIAEMSISKAPVEQRVEVSHTHDIGQMLLEAQRMASKSLVDITPKLPELPDNRIIDVTPEKGGSDE